MTDHDDDDDMTLRRLHSQLANAQLRMRNPNSTATNAHFDSKYAPLSEVRDAILPVLAEHGIAVVQEAGSSEGWVEIRTVLLFEGIERCCGRLGVAVGGTGRNAVQGLGAALTYLRRYALLAVAGLAPVAEDSDGNGVPEGVREVDPRSTLGRELRRAGVTASTVGSVLAFLSDGRITEWAEVGEDVGELLAALRRVGRDQLLTQSALAREAS